MSMSAEVLATIKRRAWEEHKQEDKRVLALSVIGTIALSAYIILFFLRVPLWWWLEVLYTWGATLGMILLYAFFKAPRLVTQTSGDESIAISEVLLTLVPFGLLLIFAGRATCMGFPPNAQFSFWVMLCTQVFAIILQIYLSIRLAERTIAAGFVPPN